MPQEEVPKKEAQKAAVPPAVIGTTCPTCGYMNEGRSRFYCKQCGAYIPKSALSMHSEFIRNGHRQKPTGAEIRIVPDGLDELRQRPVVKRPKEQPEQPVKIKKPAPQKPVFPEARQPAVPSKKRERVPQGLVNRPAEQPAVPVMKPGEVPQARPAGPAAPQGTPPRSVRQKPPQKRGSGSGRRVVFIAAAVLVVVAVIAVLVLVVPGMLDAGDGGSAPEESPGGFLSGILPGGTPEQTPAVSTATPAIRKVTPATNQAAAVVRKTTLVINQGTPVVTDTPLVI